MSFLIYYKYYSIFFIKNQEDFLIGAAQGIRTHPAMVLSHVPPSTGLRQHIRQSENYSLAGGPYPAVISRKIQNKDLK